MTQTTENPRDPFIMHLETLREREDRGALAALRRGLGKKPGAALEMGPHVIPYAPTERWAQDACFIIGSLFALHPQEGGKGNMGTSFLKLKNGPQQSAEAVERRFVALLNCLREDLPYHLRHAVSLLRNREIPIDWEQLLKDIRWWDHEDRFVQRRWANGFWGQIEKSEAAAQTAAAAVTENSNDE